MAGLCLLAAEGHLDPSLCTQAPGSLWVCPYIVGHWVYDQYSSVCHQNPRWQIGLVSLSFCDIE